MKIEDWFASGQRLHVRLPASDSLIGLREFSLFCRVQGSGPWLTFLHGFPTCSWDYDALISALGSGYRLLSFDFLGFGDSDKPHNHTYSLFEQADITEALWRQLDVQTTALVAHDYGSTVAVELLARQGEGNLSTHLERVLLMNAGLYIDVQRPTLVQNLLQKPLIGPALSRAIGERAFARQFARLFSNEHPISPEDLKQHWNAISRREGLRNYTRLIYYLTERRQNKARWESALEGASLPLLFLWGEQDPVSGAHMADRILERSPQANLHRFTDVGHYPQLEAPERVAQAFNAWRI